MRNVRFRPEKAVSCCVGLAMSHTALEGDEHEYWFDDLGTAPNPFGDEAPPAEPRIPVLESLSPGYQCFPITTPVVVRPEHQKVALEEWETTPGSAERRDALSYCGLHPRPRGVGFNQERPFRWEPLLGAYDAATKDYRGALGALVVNVEPPFRGSVWAAFTPEEASFYRQPLVTNCLRQVLSRMKRGVFLSEGGSEFFTVFAGQQFKAGARVVNFGRETVSNLTVSVSFLDAKGARQRTVLEGKLALLPGEARAVEQDGLSRSAGEESVAVEPGVGGVPIDALRHELGVWKPKAKPQYHRGARRRILAARQAVEGARGELHALQRDWPGHDALLRTLAGPRRYDPEVIERDLRRIKAMNLNAVSVFIYHESLHSPAPARFSAPLRSARPARQPIAPAGHADGFPLEGDEGTDRVLQAGGE